MDQILFRLPLVDLPIYGWGAMLFLAFFCCTWLAAYLAKIQGIPNQNIQDVGIWIFVCGILGARITYAIQYHLPLDEFFKIWDGGVVFYGSAIGGVVGYFGAYFFILRKYKISTWKMADVIAPCGALGLALGRVGCLLNGCCYGNVSCPDCVGLSYPPHISFPLAAQPRFEMTRRGYQTAAGFTLADNIPGLVSRVEPDSAAYRAGLRNGDTILKVNGQAADPYVAIGDHTLWPRGKNDVTLEVRHPNNKVEELGPFTPWTVGLHPTQVYESISMVLLLLVMLAYFPFRRHPGEVMVIFMLGYAVHRFINEGLRTDTEYVAFHMTLSQNISILVFAAGLLLALVIWLRARKPAVEGPSVDVKPVAAS